MAHSRVKAHFKATGSGIGWRSNMPFGSGASARYDWDPAQWPIVLLLGCATDDDAHVPWNIASSIIASDSGGIIAELSGNAKWRKPGIAS